jgi:serine/threonine protein kinase
MYDRNTSKVLNIRTERCYCSIRFTLFILEADYKFFARKVIRPFAAVHKKDIENEVRAINKLCQSLHPNIVQVFHHGYLKRDSAFYFMDMELCDFTLEQYMNDKNVSHLDKWSIIRAGGDLFFHVVDIALQIINGLVFIHACGEVHRDLSPQNG